MLSDTSIYPQIGPGLLRILSFNINLELRNRQTGKGFKVALITPGPLAGQISGRLASSVFSHNKGGTYVRNGTIPIKVLTPAALAAKARLQAVSQAWQALSAAERLSWLTWAQSNPRVNRLGQSITLPANAAFISLNTRLLQAGASMIDVPPLGTAPGPLATLSLEADIGAGDVAITFTESPTGANVGVWVQACILDSPAVVNVENYWRTAVITAGAETSPLDIEADVAANIGALAVGQTLHVRARTLDLTSGLASVWRQTSALVVTT